MRTERVETVEELLSRQAIVPEWMQEIVRPLTALTPVRVARLETPFGTYVLSVTPEPPVASPDLDAAERAELLEAREAAVLAGEHERLAIETGFSVVSLRKARATWYWFTTNPQGGGFGSNQVSAQKWALRAATAALPDGARYWLIVNDEHRGLQTK